MQPELSIKDSSALKDKLSNAESVSMTDTAPGQMRVIKRNGAVVAYDESKISVAITKAYLAVEAAKQQHQPEYTSLSPSWRDR